MMIISGGYILACAAALVCVTATAAAADDSTAVAPNEIILFLEGEWWNVDITISGDGDVTLNEYREIMVIKDHQTLTVTAFEIREGNDITKDIVIKLDGDSVLLAQDGFEARGVKQGNFVSLSGFHDGIEIRFRLYLMGDTYIYQKDVWENGRVVQSQMSYMQRVYKPGD